jgi:hypothetical protein
MDKYARCGECQAIAKELGEAYADAWDSSDRRTREAWDAIYKLIGGTEEDAERAEQLAPTAVFREPLRINGALQTKFAHEARVGHKVDWPVLLI